MSAPEFSKNMTLAILDERPRILPPKCFSNLGLHVCVCVHVCGFMWFLCGSIRLHVVSMWFRVISVWFHVVSCGFYAVSCAFYVVSCGFYMV